MDHTRWYSPTSCLGLLGQWKHGTAKAQVSGHEGVASALSRKLVCTCRQLLKKQMFIICNINLFALLNYFK